MKITTFLQRILLTSIGAVSTFGYAKVDIQKVGQRTTYTFTVDDLSWQERQIEQSWFSKLTLLGIENYGAILSQIGAPEIPVIRLYGQGKVTVRALGAQATLVYDDKFPLIPVQKPRVKTPEFMADLSYDSKIYESSTDYPDGGLFEVKPAGSVRGIPQFLVTLFPVTYSPKSSVYKFTKKFEVIVDETPSRQPAYAGLGPEGLLLVVGEKYAKSPALFALENHKKSLGFEVKRLIVAQGEQPDLIRSRIKDIYNSSRLSFAIIVGDQADVPGKPSNIISGVTDHYYRAIDMANYEDDINGPDIGVGRLAVSSEAQLQSVVNKILAYDMGQFKSLDWLNQVSWIATDDQWEVAEGTHNYVIDTYTKSQGFKGTFPQALQNGGDQLYAVTHRVDDPTTVRTMGLGRSVINYSGHGSRDSWAGPNVTQADVRRLSRPDSLPFVISNACITGDYRMKESFAETWQRHSFGAIAFWGSMDNTFWDEDDILERRMFDGIFKNGLSSFSQITDSALREMWRHYGGDGKSAYYRETYVLFGDPSQNLRYSAPKNPEGVVPKTLPRGTELGSFALSSGGRPLANIRVSVGVFKPNTKIVATSVSGLTNHQGLLALPIKDLTAAPGQIFVTMSGPHIKVRQELITVVP